MKCKNCGHIVDGQYCSHCGQKSNIDRITISSLLNELTESILQIDRGFFYTLIRLFTKPGVTIRAYLEGKRKKHFKPIAYVLTFSTVYFIISKMTGQNTWMDDLITGFAEGGTDKEEIPEILTWFAKNYAYTTLLVIPVFSLASFISFSGFGKNYLEHLVINSFATGQQAIIYSVLAILKKFIQGELFDLLAIIAAVGFMFIVFWQLFDKPNRMKVLIRSCSTYILYLILSSGILILIIGISEIVQ